MKKAIAVVMILALGLTFGACSLLNAPPQNYEENATQIENDTTYYNEYLGVQLTVPKGWWLYGVKEKNFSTRAQDTEDPESFEIMVTNDFSYIEMGSFANKQFSADEGYLSIDVSADKRGDEYKDILQYMGNFDQRMTSSLQEGSGITLQESKQAEAGGVTFESRKFAMTMEELNYYLETFTCQVNDGYFLTVFFRYHTTDREAPEAILDLLENNLVISSKQSN